MNRKKCKYPDCRKMVSNEITSPEETKQRCCPLHQPLIDTYQKPEECPICCSPFIMNIPLFPCCHWICKDCIIHTGKKECPVCRQEVHLDKEEEKKLNQVSRRLQREKIEHQLEEDRRFAVELERQLQEASPRRNVVQIVVTDENMDEILGILGALAPGERRIYLRALGIE